MAVLLLPACRFGFDPVVPVGGDGASGDGPLVSGRVDVTIIGKGAVTAPGLACDSACAVDAPGPVTLTATAAQGWNLVGMSAPCGAQATCTVPPGTAVTATFVMAPITANRVFLTSTLAPTTTGVAGLDAFCQARATAGSLPGTFIAFVSTSTQDASARLAGSRGWVRMDGLPIIDQVSDLGLDSQPRAVVFDELGAPHEGEFAVTGSVASGLRFTGYTCSDWSVSGTTDTGGISDGAGQFLLSGVGASCKASVYCFETGKSVPVSLHPPAFPVGRYVFITTNAFTPGPGGIASADAQCQGEATAASLPGTYRALLATTTQSAVDHLGSIAGTWRRPDGIVVTRTSLTQFPHDATLSVNAAGATRAAFLSAFGATSTTTVGTSAGTCNDWTDPTGTGLAVLQTFRFPFSGLSPGYGCNSQWPLVCAQL